MGDPHGANRRLTGYGPIRLLCAVLGVFRTIVASFLPLLAPVMIVFFVACFCVGIDGASVAPVGPCVPRWRVLYSHVRWRSETPARWLRLVGLLRVLLALAVPSLVVRSNRRWRAPLRRVRFHGGRDFASPIWRSGQSDTKVLNLSDAPVPRF